MRERIVLTKQFPGRNLLGGSLSSAARGVGGAASPEMSLNHMSMGSPFTPLKLDFSLPEEHQPHRAWLSANWIGAL